MLWETTLIILGALVAGAVSQKYGPYKGPPVVPVILPGGFIADTKEVAAAKEYFLNALAKTAADVKDDGPRDYYNTRTYQQPAYQPQKPSYQPPVPRYQPQPQYQQPTAPAYYQPQSQQPSTPTYYKPQSQRYTGTQDYQAPTSYRPAPVYESSPEPNYDDGDYHEEQIQYVPTSKRPDPMVTPVILENGYIADTQEVNAAKAEHFAAIAKAQAAVARAAKNPTAGYSGGYQTAAPAPPQQRYPEAPQGYSDY